jgi:hypothetical protein
MDEMTRIEQTIRSERRDLDKNLTELEEQVRSMADWRTHYRNHTLAAVGVAAGAGIVVGMLTARSSESAESPRALRERSGGAISAFARLDPRGRASSRLGGTWDDILDALVGVASSAAIRFVSQHVSGFEEEFTNSQSMRSGSPRSGTRG